MPPEDAQRWLDRADGRYRKALKTLADLQRLQLPVVQVNVGGHQVNIATPQVNLTERAAEPPPGTTAGARRTSRLAVTEAGSETEARSVGLPELADAAIQGHCEAEPSRPATSETLLGNQ